MAKKRAAKRKATTTAAVENEENHEESQNDSVENEAGSSNSTPGKKKKSVTKSEQKNDTSKNKAKSSKSKSDDESEEEEDYEVEKILDVKYKKNGKREFLIRWKNFSSNDDTWEPEDNLSCDDLIKKFLELQEETNAAVDNENNEESEANSLENGVSGSSRSTAAKKKKSVSTKTNQKNGTPKTKAKPSKSESDDEEEDKEDYEVEKILDVEYKKNGKKEFLIRWKNFSSKHDTWEPEDNLSCDELITKFLEKQEQREKQRKDLREHPKSVSRYAAPAGRKSKRTAGTRKSYTEREGEDDD